MNASGNRAGPATPGAFYSELTPSPKFDSHDLWDAIRRNELSAHYQPQVSSDGSRTIGVETLIRWNHPRYGMIVPSDIVAMAEQTSLINDLGKWMLQQACTDGLQWPDLVIGVNVSPNQFKSPGMIDQIIGIIDRSGLPFDRVEIEITENAYFDDVDRAERDMQRLREKGIRFALDDFGVGYASLTYLRRLPFDKLKIDKSFVDDVHTVGSAAIIQAITSLCRAIGIKVTAEGVETVEQQKFLRLCGCNYLQGYLFSKPVPASTIAEFLALQQSRAAALPLSVGGR